MIPPITTQLIANAIQTKNMVAAGYDYWQQGRVSDLAIDADMAMITADVGGSARHPYEVTIAFADLDGDDQGMHLPGRLRLQAWCGRAVCGTGKRCA